MEYVTLRNGVEMPILGYGVYQVTAGNIHDSVAWDDLYTAITRRFNSTPKHSKSLPRLPLQSEMRSK